VIGKKPLDFILRQFHDAMEELLDYERDNSFVPSKDQLVLFARLHAQLRQFAFTLHVLNRKMRDRAKGIDYRFDCVMAGLARPRFTNVVAGLDPPSLLQTSWPRLTHPRFYKRHGRA
jgi:hypothetical protein